MRLRLHAAAAVLSLVATPALAQQAPTYPGGPYPGEAYSSDGPEAPRYGGYEPAARDAWLADCRHRLSARDSGVGGALIGGAVGGFAGNRIAGRGNRTVGTLAGAAVGAVAGAAIDKAEDAGRNRDECEAYLDDYYARYTQSGAYRQASYPAQQHCTETVEYVTEDVPVRPARRVIPRRAKIVPDKRVKLVPVK